jgi:hypothetical protein
MLCYGFAIKGPTWSAKDSPQKAPLEPCSSGRSQGLSQSLTQRMMKFPTQLSKTRYL